MAMATALGTSAALQDVQVILAHLQVPAVSLTAAAEIPAVVAGAVEEISPTNKLPKAPFLSHGAYAIV